MSFTRTFQYDVFISYASADNVAPDGREYGLVSAFHRDLRTELKRLGIGDELKIFFDDRSIQDHGGLTEQIVQAASSSAVMIVFHSPAYDESRHWCHREFYLFSTSQSEWKQHLFLIALNKDTLPTSSPLLGGVAVDQRFRSFFDKNGFSFRTDEPLLCNAQSLTFSKEVVIIARQLAPLLRNARRSAPAKVFLTCSSDLFRPEWNRIRNELMVRGYEVYESGPWIDEHVRVADAERLIYQSNLVVGIEESFGTERDQPPSQHSGEQRRIASELGKKQLRWLPTVRHGFSDEEYGRRMESREVKCVGLQEFIGLTVAALEVEVAKHSLVSAASSPEGTVETPSRFVLLVCAGHDENGALAELCDAIDELDVPRDGHVDFPPHSDPEAIRAWWKGIKDSSVSDHVKLLFLDGACDRDWIDSHLRNYRALRGDLGKKLSVGLCECPPIPKAKEQRRRFRPTGLMPIFQHDDREALRTFVLQ